MSRSEHEPEVPVSSPNGGDEGDSFTPEQREVIDSLRTFINELWGDPKPCPYCNWVAWSADPTPVILQRSGAPTGFGVPVFLIWCTHCGNEVSVSVAVTGLWEKVFGQPIPDPGEYAPVEVTPPRISGSSEAE